MEFRDYYKVLGVRKSSTAEEIKKMFRKLARQYHPDVNPGDRAAEKRFKEISEAHEVLGDPEKRRKYDELGANWQQYEQGRAGGVDPFGRGDASRFGGRTAGFRTVSQHDVRDMFGENPFSDFFQTFFGGHGEPAFRSHRPPTRPRAQGRDIEHRLELTLEEAFYGLGQRLSLNSRGRSRSVEIRIPVGVTDGSRVRVVGEGEPGTGTAPGDLFLRVRLKAHPRFDRKKRDLYVKTTVPVTTAVLGGHVDVPTIEGKAVRLRVPEHTQPGQVFRLKGKGMPHLRGNGRGDLYATIQLSLPTALSAEARQHYEALEALEEGPTAKQSTVEAGRKR